MTPLSPFRAMLIVFSGFAISLSYGVFASLLLRFVESDKAARLFFEAYTTSFRTLISFGLVTGTALYVYLSQNLIPQVVEAAFTAKQLASTEYFNYKDRLFSRRRSVTFSAEFALIGAILFTHCTFPLPDLAATFMVIAACAEYALGVYVGRKLGYGGMILHALLQIRVTRNIFKKRELDEINTYVNVASTLTVLFVYLSIVNYHNGPFSYGTPMGASARVFLLLPALIATPVLLIFNFYPRIVLGRIYSASIDVEMRKLKGKLANESLSLFERMSLLVEFDKLRRDELRHGLRLAVSDLPIVVTIFLMVAGHLIDR